MKKNQIDSLKNVVKNWLIDIDKTEVLPSDIIALSFNLYMPYGLELVGSKSYDKEDDDWACEEDFKPKQRKCPDFEVPYSLEWEEVLKIVVGILKELVIELSSTNLFSVKHIAAGFVDGDLIVIK